MTPAAGGARMELVCDFKDLGSRWSPGIWDNNRAILVGALECLRSRLGFQPAEVGGPAAEEKQSNAL